MNLSPSFINRTLSLRISLMVVFAIAMLMMAALLVMSFYARRAVKEEAVRKAEQTLDIVVRKTDNVLLSVEQTAGNTYFELVRHLNQPEELRFYCRETVKANPYIEGCAIAFDPEYHRNGEGPSMYFFHRASVGRQNPSAAQVLEVEPATLAPYTDKAWYKKVVTLEQVGWSMPFKDDDDDQKAIVTFGIPIHDFALKRAVGVLAVGVSLQTLSDLVLKAKPSPNSYATLFDYDGNYIVHPDSTVLHQQDVLTRVSQSGADPSVKEVAQAMMSGESGYRELLMDGQDSYVFFRPFKRLSTPLRDESDLSWSVGIVYPKQDIFDGLAGLQLFTIFTAIVALLLVLLLCYGYLRRQLLPLRMLTASAQHISKGHFDETIPDSQQIDEVGQLQNHFQQMQRALSERTDNLNLLISQLNEQGEHLKAAYEQSKEADRMKTAFLHNMSDKMIPPVEKMAADVSALCQADNTLSPEQVNEKVDNIQRQGKTLTKLLNDLLMSSTH